MARGYTQVFGVDYTETLAPVTRLETLRLLFAVAVQMDWEIRQIDVKTAYLYGDLDEEIYMELLLEYERLRSLHVLVDSLFTRSLPLYFDPIDIDGGLLPNRDVSRQAGPRPSRGVGRLRPLDSNTHLPSETLDHIVGNLPGAERSDPLLGTEISYLRGTERRNFRNCCLVSKSWVPRARKHLFFHVTFSNAKGLESWKDTLMVILFQPFATPSI